MRTLARDLAQALLDAKGRLGRDARTPLRVPVVEADVVSGHLTVNCLVGVKPAAGLAFVRHPETEDTYRGGQIIVPDAVRDKLVRQQMVVVSLGDYERCEEEKGECRRSHDKRGRHPHRLWVGNWVIVRGRSWLASPDPDVYVIKVSDILGVLQEAGE